MANTLATPTWVVNETAQRFVNSVKGIANFNRSYNDEYRQSGTAVGNTILARIPSRFSVSLGQAWAPQAIVDNTVPITLSYQAQVGFDYSSAQATTELDRIRERYVNRAADALASYADYQGMQDVYTSVNNAVGTLGTAPSSTSLPLNARMKIADGAGPLDNLKAVLDFAASIGLAGTTTTLFNPTNTISENYKAGRMGSGQLGISEWFEDQNVPRHTSGTFTACSPTVNGASQTGSTLVTQAWASGATTLKKGDIFTIANVLSVNPLQGQSTGRLQQFVITADATDSTGAITLNIYPSIITSGPNQTVNTSPANAAAISVWSTAAGGALSTTVSPQSLIFDDGFAAFVMADLVDPRGGADASFARSKDFGLSIRFVQQYQLGTDQNGARLDCLFGAAPLQPRLACRMVG